LGIGGFFDYLPVFMYLIFPNAIALALLFFTTNPRITDYNLPCNWMDREQGEGHEFLHEATQVKNIWVPTGE
jgi:hypothetical protein